MSFPFLIFNYIAVFLYCKSQFSINFEKSISFVMLSALFFVSFSFEYLLFFHPRSFFCRNVNGKCFHSIFSSQVIILNFLDKTSLCVMFMFFCVYKRPPCVCLLKQLNRVTEKKFNMMKLNC